ncbi:MAG: xanthine dehydrogenase family protein molybdopterin-binding subunit [Acidimicrobiales bacterium]
MARHAPSRDNGAGRANRRYVGSSHPGLRNRQLAAGRSSYVGDFRPTGVLHLAVLRSPHAHARIHAIDVSRARAAPGVVDVLTGAEIEATTDPIPDGWDTVAVGARHVDWYALCVDRTRYVGEAVAAVVAESPWAAFAALRDVEVDYEPLAAVVDPFAALDPTGALVEPSWGTNVLVERRLESGDVDAATADAFGVVEGRITTPRTTGVPLEPRGVLADWDRARGTLTVWDSTQNPHPLRVYLSLVLRIPESKIRVIQPEVGGAFGLKQPTLQEEPLVAYASIKLRRPVRWIEERAENFMATGHAKEMVADYRATYLADGLLTSIEVDIVADVGAPSSLVGWGMTFTASGLIPGPYKVPNTRVRLRAVTTNKCPWNAYRGFGKDVANLWLERIVDHVARQLGCDGVDVRRRNFVQPDEFPFRLNSGSIVDSGDYPGSIDRVVALVDHASFERRRRTARAEGRRLGLGFGHELSPEGCAMPGSVMISGYDGSTVRVDPGGSVTVLSGVTSPGNGNETALAQIAADAIGCELDAVRVIQGDTLLSPWGLGNYSSRGIIIGGSAVQLAAEQLRHKLLEVAANMLEANAQDLRAEQGRIQVKGAPVRSIPLAEVVDEIYRRPYGPNARDVEPGLEATRYFRAANVNHRPDEGHGFNAYPTWPSAAAACVVEVDADTGYVRVDRLCVVDDVGTIVNPLLVEANLHGAAAQALGAGLFEQLAYDESGQILATTLMDYTIPTAVELPRFEIDHQTTPSPFTPLGTKGAGESAMGCTIAALCAAVEDAFPELDLCITSLPLTPSAVWRAIRDAPRRDA